MTAPYGRRGLPPAEDDPEATLFAFADATPPPEGGARRAAPPPEAPSLGAADGPRRAALQDDADLEDHRRAWYWVAVLGLVIAVAIGVLWLVFGTGDSDRTAVPQPTSSPSASGSLPSQDATVPPTVADGTTSTVPLPQPGQGPPTAQGQPSTATQPADPNRIELGDGAAFTLLPGWELYADEVVQNQRRLVRVREPAADVRIQAVTLTTVEGPLDEACLNLISDHRQLFTGVSEGLPVSVSISGEGAGVSCTFTGTRSSDGAETLVEFTLLQRGAETLVFRDTLPADLPPDSPARPQLVAMECEAAQGFGVAVDQCALTPGQGDG